MDLRHAVQAFAIASAAWACTGMRQSAHTVEATRWLAAGPSLRAAVEACTTSVSTCGALRAFYQRRGYRPGWVGPTGPLGHADALLLALASAPEHGLDPARYRTRALQQQVSVLRSVASEPTAGQLAALDVGLTTAFLRYGGELRRGRVRPADVGEAWPAASGADLAGVLQTALDVGDPRTTLARLAPPQPEYARLQEALRQYRRAARAGGWPPPPSASLHPGDRGAAVDSLVRRLIATGDLSWQEATSAVFDGAVIRGLQAFQRRHGLSLSGRLDGATARALSVPARERANQLAAALERWRWLPHELGSRYVLVRIADFELDVIEDGRRIMTRRVVVGEPYRRTPVFGSRIERLVVNPSWYIPERIAREEVLPLLQADPGASARLGIRVRAGAGQSGSSVDWGAVADGGAAPHLVQLPGPPNPLGKVKFDFANSFQVYLHDTPNLAVFRARDRDLSHGCIRVDGARELAGYLMGHDGGGRGTPELAAAWESTETRILKLPDPVPIYVLYWTARVTADGEVHFRRDLYDGDRRLMAALGLQ